MQRTKSALLWARVGCVAGSVAGLLLVFHRLDFTVLAAALRQLRLGWFIGALVAYGLIFIPAAWRWHIALRLVHGSVHPGASARLTLIGHFFYTLFFGPIGGD